MRTPVLLMNWERGDWIDDEKLWLLEFRSFHSSIKLSPSAERYILPHVDG